tara:strand:+ start:465 stop:1550 length:1086 start_codon:yes stop_codon:yes gene_type:complete
LKLYIVTGEKSGDLQASLLVEKLHVVNNNIKIRAFGGEHLKKTGVEISSEINRTSVMGLTNVLMQINTIRKKINFCKIDILKFNPNAIILVDYPAFNLRIARFAKEHGIQVFYYIAPKVWAWNKSRLSKIKKYIDSLLVIFPFEVDFFKKHNINAIYVGNPLISHINKFKSNKLYISKKNIIAVLPGSRKQEISKILPIMLSVSSSFKKYQFVIAGISDFGNDFYESFINRDNIEVRYDSTYSLLSESKFALVTSGTATLEVSLFNIPQIVCYKTDWITYLFARLFVKIKFISLVNIIYNKYIVPELIQSQLNKLNLIKHVKQLVNGDYNKDYQNIQQIFETNQLIDPAKYILDKINQSFD